MSKIAIFGYPSCVYPLPPTEAFRKICRGCQRMAKVPNGVEKLPEISTGGVWVHERYRRQTDGRLIAYSEREREWTWVHVRWKCMFYMVWMLVELVLVSLDLLIMLLYHVDPSAAANRRIRQIFVRRRKSAEKNSASAVIRRILIKLYPPDNIRLNFGCRPLLPLIYSTNASARAD